MLCGASPPVGLLVCSGISKYGPGCRAGKILIRPIARIRFGSSLGVLYDSRARAGSLIRASSLFGFASRGKDFPRDRAQSVSLSPFS